MFEAKASLSEVSIRLIGFSRIDYNKAPIRKALRLEGNAIRDVARRLVGGRGVSMGGEFPGLRSGVLRRAIKAKVARSGLAVFVRPEKTAKMGKDFYPAFLVRGVKQGAKVGRLAAGEGLGKSNRRKRGGRVAAIAERNSSGWRIAPREDYMHTALSRRSAEAINALRSVMESALVPRK